MSINYWTPEEDKLLKELYQTKMIAADIAKRLGRTTEAVMKRAAKFGLTKHRVIYHGCTEDCFNCEYSDCKKAMRHVLK